MLLDQCRASLAQVLGKAVLRHQRRADRSHDLLEHPLLRGIRNRHENGNLDALELRCPEHAALGRRSKEHRPGHCRSDSMEQREALGGKNLAAHGLPAAQQRCQSRCILPGGSDLLRQALQQRLKAHIRRHRNIPVAGEDGLYGRRSPLRLIQALRKTAVLRSGLLAHMGVGGDLLPDLRHIPRPDEGRNLQHIRRYLQGQAAEEKIRLLDDLRGNVLLPVGVKLRGIAQQIAELGQHEPRQAEARGADHADLHRAQLPGAMALHALQRRTEMDGQITDFLIPHGKPVGLGDHRCRPGRALENLRVLPLDIGQQGIHNGQMVLQPYNSGLEMDVKPVQELLIQPQAGCLTAAEGLHHAVDEIENIRLRDPCGQEPLRRALIPYLRSLDVKQQIGKLQLRHLQLKLRLDGAEDPLGQLLVLVIRQLQHIRAAVGHSTLLHPLDTDDDMHHQPHIGSLGELLQPGISQPVQQLFHPADGR